MFGNLGEVIGVIAVLLDIEEVRFSRADPIA